MLEFLKKKRNLRIGILAATAVGILVLSYRLSAVVNPLLIALLIAYILNPLVSRIERIKITVFGRSLGPGRTGAVAAIYIAAIGGVAALFVIVVPVVFREISYLSFAIPGEEVLDEKKAFSPPEAPDRVEGDAVAAGRPVTEPFDDRNRNGRRDRGEKWSDLNGNGHFDSGEPYADSNRNGKWDKAEPFADDNGNGTYDPPETFDDQNGDGRWTPGEFFHDLNGDGVFNPCEPFTDLDGNGIRDSDEPFVDRNGNGAWDEGESFTDRNGNGRHDKGEPFEDLNSNGAFETNESLVFTDRNGNRRYDPPEPFDDSDGDGDYDAGESFKDQNGDGAWNQSEQFSDWNGNGTRDAEIRCPLHVTVGTEAFEDSNGNGRRDDAEAYTDSNGNGSYDAYFFFVDENQNGLFDLGYALGAVQKLRVLLDKWNRRFPSQRIDITFESVRDEVVTYLKGGGDEFESFSSWILYATKSGIMGIFDIISIFVLIPFYTFFFLKSLDGIREAIYANLPGRYRERIWSILRDIHLSVSSFFRGRLAVCFVVAAATWLVLVLFDVRFSLLLGILMGMSVIVPFLSVVVVTIPVAVILAIDGASGIKIVGALAALAAIQNLENFVLTPKVLGKETQLHPVTIFVSFLVGGSLFGLFGVLLAVPLASIAKILGREFIMPQIRALAREAPGERTSSGETGIFERKDSAPR